MPYESIRKPGDPDFVPDSAGGLGGGIGSHAGHRMAYDACIFFRITIGFSASGRLSLGRDFQRQSALLEQAVQQIQSCLDGNPDARLDCDREGELYRLLHSVNALTAVLSAHADNEQREKRFLKNTMRR